MKKLLKNSPIAIINRIRINYNILNAPTKAALWYTFCNIAQKGISLLSTPIFTRIMTTSQYGVYSVYQSWYSVITIFATLNLYAGVYNNGMTDYPEDRPKFTSSLQGLSTTITLVLFVIYLCSIKFWNNIFGLSTIYVLAMFIELLFVPAYNFWSAGQRYDYKYKKLVAVTLLIIIASPLTGVLAVLSTEYKAEARVLSYVTIQVCVGLVLYIYNLVKGKAFFVKKYWKFALAFNIPLIPHYLSQTILNQSDRIMISNMVGSSEAAIYSVAYTVSMMMTIVTNAINNSFVPYTYKSLKNGNSKGIAKNANYLVILVGMACIVAMCFGPEIICIFAAPDYYEARWIIPPVATALFFMFLFPLYCNIEFYYKETKCIMVASCLAAGLNILLNYFGIQLFGYITAAYTTLICYIVLAITHYFVHLWVLKKNGIQEKIYNSRFFMLLSIVLIAVMIGMTLIYDHAIVRYAIIAVILVVSVIKRGLIRNLYKEFSKNN